MLRVEVRKSEVLNGEEYGGGRSLRRKVGFFFFYGLVLL